MNMGNGIRKEMREEKSKKSSITKQNKGEWVTKH